MDIEMIIVSGTAIMKPEYRDEALRACLEVTAPTKQETGCIAYDFYTAVADPNRLHVYEEWESDTALHAHIEMPHTQNFLGKIGSYLAEPPVIIHHAVRESGPAL